MTPPANDDGAARWYYVGRSDALPNITDTSARYFKLAWPQAGSETPGCRVFHPRATTADEICADAAVGADAWAMREQVLVFRYRGRVHAVDHACPHRAYSLTWGRPFDIEDAGRVLGAGLRCGGHGYAFELGSGIGDRGGYRLGVWEVELRGGGGGGGGEGEDEVKEVWVRRRQEGK